MTTQPFMKFYCADWRADPRLRMCSLAARGLWIDLMSYAHEGEPYGHLTIDGKIPSIEDIAALVARPLREVRTALTELEQRNVFSRGDNGVIISRRMVRDKAKAETDRTNGKGGGNPKLRGSDNGGVNPQDKAQILEAIVRKKDDAPSGADEIVFESGRIRLKAKNLSQWENAFVNLDVKAELLGLSQWADTQGNNWFCAVSGALTKRNREVGIRKSAAQKGVPLTPAGTPYPDGII